MLWLSFGIMLLVAAVIVFWPLHAGRHRLPSAYAASIVAAIAASIALYALIGTPATPPPSSQLPSIEEMVASLEERLQRNPENVAGWKMLGRSYIQLRRFPKAVEAFERAVALEAGSDGQTLADLGEALLMADGTTLLGRAGELFENALAVSPDNQKALFYAGMAAIERGDAATGADRWEALLATSPPPEIREILRQKVAELRGEEPPPPPPMELPGTVVAVNVQLGDAAAAAARPDSTVFIIARDPAQPSPPVAAVRRKVSELPAIVPIADSDAMIPGRVPSGFERLEIVARVSMSGQPIAQPGDWFGSEQISPADTSETSIVIDTRVQ